MLPLFAIYGVSGYGREVMPLAREQVRKLDVPFDRLVFIDDNSDVDSRNNHRVMSYSEFMATAASSRYVALAIAESSVRERLLARCIGDSIQAWEVVAPNVVIMDDVQIGEGAILSPFVTLTSNIRIGRHFQANIYSYVAHDCVIGDFVTFGPGVKCNGNVLIEDYAYIGAGAVIKQGRPGNPLVIGRGAVVGMGAVVTKDVPANTTVVGSPAKPLSYRA